MGGAEHDIFMQIVWQCKMLQHRWLCFNSFHLVFPRLQFPPPFIVTISLRRLQLPKLTGEC